MRTSPVYYIAPSAISITPNANGSQRDLAVYLDRGAKIRVHCPRAGIGMDDAEYQEWTLTGRNRRLADTTGSVPYTIYARLSKTDENTGYLVFVKKIRRGNGWVDAYSSLTLDEKSADGYSVLYTNNGFDVKIKSPDYYYIRLGDVSDAGGGQRTVTLDTGILGTDDYNNKWVQSPDDLPLRIELGCTINDEDMGLNPYVYWNQSLVLTATLTEGWAGTEIQRFDHWEISRKTDNDPKENRLWLVGDEREKAFRTSGEITLNHLRSKDDFNGAVATTFTIMAMEVNPEYAANSGLAQYLVLKSATITILAETIEKYELALSSAIASYSPQTGSYSPAKGVTVRIRATDQRGDVFELTNKQYANASLRAFYAPVGSNFPALPNLVFSGADNAVAIATIPTTGKNNAFSAQQSLNVRLAKADGTELALETIAFVRDGEDSKEREWIFLRSQTAITFIDNTKPSNIEYGQVNPTQAAEHVTDKSNQDGWVPEGWWDEMQGTNEAYPYEYGAYRDYNRATESWGQFSAPKIWSHYGEDGKSYYIEKNIDSIHIPTDIDSVSVHVRAMVYCRIGQGQEEEYPCFWAIYKRYGNSFERIYYQASKSYFVSLSGLPVSSNTSDSNYTEAVVVVCSNSALDGADLQYVLPSSYVAKEEFPVIKDGDTGPNGDDAVTYDILPSVSVISADSNGIVSTGAIEVAAYRIVGTTRRNLNLGGFVPIDIQGNPAPHYYAEYSVDGREWEKCSSWESGTPLLHRYTSGVPSTVVKATTDGIALRLKHSSDANTVLKEIPPIKVVKDGAAGPQGSTGHTGRFYFYAGEYNEENGIYRIEPTQAPYVKFTGPDDNNNMQTGFFMLDNGGEEPPSTNWPTDGHPTGPTFKTGVSSPWSKMQSEHQYYIARAFFGENAYLGSFIINGDWMISQYGTYKPDANTTIVINENNVATYPSAYTSFNPTDPLATGSANGESTYPCFAPNFAVDGKTGKTYQNDTIIRGEVHATSGEFNGIVKASTFFTGATKKDGDYTINPANGDKSLIITGASGAVDYEQRIILPSVVDHEGMILRFFNPYVTRSSVSGVIVAQGNDSIYEPGDPFESKGQKVYLQHNKVVSYIAITDINIGGDTINCWVLMN